MTASLYIHVPFCASICDYCDFYSISINNNFALMDGYINAVLGDIEDQIGIFNVGEVPTIYIGGGTPSVLGAVRMERLLAGIQAVLKPLRKKPGVKMPFEFTVEANPESADEAFLRACREGGVSRISLGIQTFHGPSRLAVRRTGDCRLLREQAVLAAGYFPGAFSADLITGLPFQTREVLESDITALLSCQPSHVSLYSLILEPETPLGREAARLGAAAIALPCQDDTDGLWIAGRDMLEAAGLAQYEVSNFALPNKACAHNARYWRMENWLGAGPAASGTLIDEEAGTGRRLTYPADIGTYLAAPRPRVRSARVEELSRADLVRESMLMGFRCRGGPDTGSFRRRFGRGVEDLIPKTIDRWRERGFFEAGDSVGLAPSRQGLLFLNGFLRDAFAELEGF
ncbi:MAG: radical SAM family heme chaperone HemW [Treponema sp.]|jgi:oxygen-independent coproporphyrinogen-3 oxidase|nr:radical SAM family heme chaperone HemW [Treponema sp.]